MSMMLAYSKSTFNDNTMSMMILLAYKVGPL